MNRKTVLAIIGVFVMVGSLAAYFVGWFPVRIMLLVFALGFILILPASAEGKREGTKYESWP